MPKQYEAIRDKFASKGMPMKEAEMHAAKIYNSKHPGNPVGRNSDMPDRKMEYMMRRKRRKRAANGQ